MATPFKDPRTGIFYFRRVVPAALRPFFDGASIEYKRTLYTRDPDEARQRYYPHAVIYEQKLAAARRALAAAENSKLRRIRAIFKREKDVLWKASFYNARLLFGKSDAL